MTLKSTAFSETLVLQDTGQAAPKTLVMFHERIPSTAWFGSASTGRMTSVL